jgi:hypothetical protein
MSEMIKAGASEMMELAQVSEMLVRSSFCGVKRPEDALWIVATGHSLGIDPVTSLRGIHVISGKPVLSADLMAAVAMRHPDCEYLRVAEMTAERATVHVKRRGWPEHTAFTFTLDDAKAAGLLGNATWKKYPADMCKARAIARAARAAFPDALLGVYVDGEIEEAQEPARVEALDVTPTLAPEVRRAPKAAEEQTPPLTQLREWLKEARLGKSANIFVVDGFLGRFGEGAEDLASMSEATLAAGVAHIEAQLRKGHELADVLRDLTEWAPQHTDAEITGPERTPTAA